MKNDDNRKNYRRQKIEHRKKNKQFLDEDTFYQHKLNKQFKHKKKSVLEEQEDWTQWDSDEL